MCVWDPEPGSPGQRDSAVCQDAHLQNGLPRPPVLRSGARRKGSAISRWQVWDLHQAPSGCDLVLGPWLLSHGHRPCVFCTSDGHTPCPRHLKRSCDGSQQLDPTSFLKHLFLGHKGVSCPSHVVWRIQRTAQRGKVPAFQSLDCSPVSLGSLGHLPAFQHPGMTTKIFLSF